MSRPESWEAIARALGARMEYQANACPYGNYTSDGSGRMHLVGVEGEAHVPDVAAADCPHCADTIAYRRYLARTRGERYTPKVTSPER